jgi:diacylglycerol kinase (ATP)
LSQQVFVVFNPQSGKGRGARLVQPVLRALGAEGGIVEHDFTKSAGDEARLTAEAIARGFRKIVAVGGDGTWSNVADAILRSGAPVQLGLIAGGTGCDFAKSLGLPARDVAASARIIHAGVTRRIDVGRIEDRHFLNVAGFGFDIAVLEDSWKVHYLSGGLLYVYCALRQLYSFPGFSVEMAIDGAPAQRRELMMLILANARVFGGGFQIAPRADLADGRLNAVAFDNMSVGRRLPLMLRLLKGSHEATREVASTTGSSFTLRFDRPPAYETDGEWNQAKSAELEVRTLPAALEVIVPSAA